MTPRETRDSHLSPISNRYFPAGLSRSPARAFAPSTVTYSLRRSFSPFHRLIFLVPLGTLRFSTARYENPSQRV